jgi:hypothetical protein
MKTKQKSRFTQEPNQGHRREQYEFAATMAIAAIGGLFIIAIALLIINSL